VGGLGLSLLLVTPAPAAVAPGVYDGSQMEMAVRLVLRPDGKFGYALSYGALDEQASGTWRAEKDGVALDSDPVKALRFTLLHQDKGDDRVVQFSLELPEGMDAQYFLAGIELADGRVMGGHFSADGYSFPLEPGQQPVRVQIALPVFDISSDPVGVDPAKGLRFRFRFEPNELGRVDFRGTMLRAEKGQLVLQRHGLSLHFRRMKPGA